MSEAKFAEVFAGRWNEQAADLDLFNQLNAALYEDVSTWFVPGTNVRLWDTPEELTAAHGADRAALENHGARRNEPDQERFLREYCLGMPGAVQLRLEPGDVVLYRNVAWHLGSYVPYRKRATLHCTATTENYDAFVQRATALLEKP
jgi:hypothetical protein